MNAVTVCQAVSHPGKVGHLTALPPTVTWRYSHRKIGLLIGSPYCKRYLFSVQSIVRSHWLAALWLARLGRGDIQWNEAGKLSEWFRPEPTGLISFPFEPKERTYQWVVTKCATADGTSCPTGNILPTSRAASLMTLPA